MAPWHYAPLVLMVLSVLAVLLVLVVFAVLVWWCWRAGMCVGILGGIFVVLFDYGTMQPSVSYTHLRAHET